MSRISSLPGIILSSNEDKILMILISTCWEAAAALLRQDEAKAEKAEKREDASTLGIHPDTQIQINTQTFQ